MKKILFLLIILFVSCSEQKSDVTPSDIIDKPTFVFILEEVHMIESEYQLTKINKKDKSENKLIDDYTKLYSEFKITKSEFENSMNYYSHHSEDLEGIYEEVLSNLQERQSNLK